MKDETKDSAQTSDEQLHFVEELDDKELEDVSGEGNTNCGHICVNNSVAGCGGN